MVSCSLFLQSAPSLLLELTPLVLLRPCCGLLPSRLRLLPRLPHGFFGLDRPFWLSSVVLTLVVIPRSRAGSVPSVVPISLLSSTVSLDVLFPDDGVSVSCSNALPSDCVGEAEDTDWSRTLDAGEREDGVSEGWGGGIEDDRASAR